MMTNHRVCRFALIAALSLSPLATQGRGMSAEARRTIHGLFDSHDKFHREVRETDTGYVSTTTSKDPALVKLLQAHVTQMEERLKQGLMVRRWDPAYEEFVRYYDEIDIRITKIENGISVTATGATAEGAKVARNHARIVSAFLRKGWSEHDKTHPAVAANKMEARANQDGKAGAESADQGSGD
jgi:hypothetical protein